MEISNEIEKVIESELKQVNYEKLKQEAQKLSNRYCKEKRENQRFISSQETALAYAIIRMPATYTAVQKVLEEWQARTFMKEEQIQTILDLGAGTGATTLALKEVFSQARITCVEREVEMMKLGKKFVSYLEYENVKWEKKDLLKEKINTKVDLIIESYLCNEWTEEDCKKVFVQMLNSAKQFVILVEPGTPDSFQRIEMLKKIGREKNFNIIAPCTHDEKCKLQKGDWCHSICRVQRSKIHRKLKQGELAYEDEKFSYVIFSKEKFSKAERRILRRPMIEKNRVMLKVCTKNGIEEIVITKKEKEQYKFVKKKSCGDEF